MQQEPCINAAAFVATEDMRKVPDMFRSFLMKPTTASSTKKSRLHALPDKFRGEHSVPDLIGAGFKAVQTTVSILIWF